MHVASDVKKYAYQALYTIGLMVYLAIFFGDPGIYLLNNADESIRKYFEGDDIEMVASANSNEQGLFR